MIMPIVAYGHPTLRKKSIEIDKDYPDLKDLIDNMFETMYETNGIGLAAPQINKNIRLFIIDATPYSEILENHTNLKKVFINPKIIEKNGQEWPFMEGCLSIPGIMEKVIRESNIHIQYYDEHFNFYDEVIDGILSRIIQHEYDHIDGILFVDRINPLRKIMIKGKLNDISKGIVKNNYKMIFSKTKK